jgi:hypothetical protein
VLEVHSAGPKFKGLLRCLRDVSLGGSLDRWRARDSRCLHLHPLHHLGMARPFNLLLVRHAVLRWSDLETTHDLLVLLDRHRVSASLLVAGIDSHRSDKTTGCRNAALQAGVRVGNLSGRVNDQGRSSCQWIRFNSVPSHQIGVLGSGHPHVLGTCPGKFNFCRPDHFFLHLGICGL